MRSGTGRTFAHAAGTSSAAIEGFQVFSNGLGKIPDQHGIHLGASKMINRQTRWQIRSKLFEEIHLNRECGAAWCANAHAYGLLPIETG